MKLGGDGGTTIHRSQSGRESGGFIPGFRTEGHTLARAALVDEWLCITGGISTAGEVSALQKVTVLGPCSPALSHPNTHGACPCLSNTLEESVSCHGQS